MNLLLLEPNEAPSDGALRLTDRRADHLRRVLQVEPGTRVRVGVIRGPTGDGVVRAVSDDAVELSIELHDDSTAARPAVDLVLAIPRPKVLRRLLRAIASFGIGRIDLVNAWRVEKSYFQSPGLEPAALRRELVLGCEQGATTWVPDIEVHRLLMPFVETHLDRADDRTRALLHPRAAAPIEKLLVPGSTAAVLAAVGPEGGWIERELDTFEALGFRAVSLGRPVLRVETAVAALLAQIALLRRL